MSSISVGEAMNTHNPMLEANSNFIWRKRFVGYPTASIIQQ
jgi:hypothetical protein